MTIHQIHMRGGDTFREWPPKHTNQKRTWEITAEHHNCRMFIYSTHDGIGLNLPTNWQTTT